MKKLVVAGMLGLAACTGLSGIAVSGPLFGAGGSFGTINSQQPPVIRVQANEAYRVQQLEEQIRQLNGRIEEMSFQLLRSARRRKTMNSASRNWKVVMPAARAQVLQRRKRRRRPVR